MVTLEFKNKTAKLGCVTLKVRAMDIAPIMAWYGAYFAGDNYKVYADGKQMKMDINGEKL